MKSALIRYLRHLLVFSGILGIAATIVAFLVPGKYISPALPFLFVFFFATSLLSFHYLVRASARRFIKFVNTFLLTIIAKLFIYAGVMISYALMHRSDAIPFMIGFFVLYLCYTVFEAASVVKFTQQSSQDGPG